MTGRALVVVVAMVVALLVSGAVARGGVIWSGQGPVMFRSLPGEANRLTLIAAGEAESATTTIHDDGAAMHANTCAPLDPNTIRCPGEFMFGVGLGDENDTLSSSSVAVFANGGKGDDVLNASAQADFLAGGSGNDRIAAGSGDDQVADDAGNDGLAGAAGIDLLSLREGTRPSIVDLMAGTVRTGPEHDVVSGFENVDGGAGADVLRGDDGPNQISADGNFPGAGGDVLVGRGGADVLRGVFGKSVTYDAGAGDDVIKSFAKTERISCGLGSDEVWLFAGGGVVVPPSCEHVRASGAVFDRGKVLAGLFTTRVRSPSPARCTATLTIGEPVGRVYGSATFSLPTAGTDLSLPLNARGRRLARRHGLAELHVVGRCLRAPVWRTRL